MEIVLVLVVLQWVQFCFYFIIIVGWVWLNGVLGDWLWYQFDSYLCDDVVCEVLYDSFCYVCVVDCVFVLVWFDDVGDLEIVLGLMYGVGYEWVLLGMLLGFVYFVQDGLDQIINLYVFSGGFVDEFVLFVEVLFFQFVFWLCFCSVFWCYEVVCSVFSYCYYLYQVQDDGVDDSLQQVGWFMFGLVL